VTTNGKSRPEIADIEEHTAELISDLQRELSQEARWPKEKSS
jgi:hypothetical protein